jgi:uncharacterized integral membrane protein
MVALVFVVAAIVFMVDNTRRTSIRFPGRVISAPLWMALAGTLAVGLVAGALATHRKH